MLELVLEGWLGFTMCLGILQVGSAAVQTWRDTSGANGDFEMETEGSYGAASSQLSGDEDGDGGPPSLTPPTQPITGAGVG